MPVHIIPLDLLYMDLPGAIGAYLVRDEQGTAVLIEAGPANTIAHLEQALAAHSMCIEDLDACCITHIHLDHAGAAGVLAQRGVPIHVHAFGMQHLIDPSKLLASAKRIYGAGMQTLWGETIPAPSSMVHPVEDQDVIAIGDIRLRAIETPGHARHHHAFELELDDHSVCFSGDAAAMLLPGTDFVSVPMPPPEFDLELWLKSVELLRNGPWSTLLLTHGGAVPNIDAHLDRFTASMLRQVELITSRMKDGTPEASLLAEYRNMLAQEAAASGVPKAMFDEFVTDNLLGMNIAGIRRWQAKMG
ncbi:MAG: MBL fold metallo-hydrolase [Phycisphaerales bacterium]|nr:MBL fold metallo-hydrolase [Phycisphaerales bacterium]